MTSRTSNLLDKFGISLVAGALLLSAPALASASRGAAADRTDGSVATTATISPDTLHHWADAGATGEDPATLHHWPHQASAEATISPDTLHHWADAGATGEDPATLHHWPHRASTLASIDPDTLHHWP